jgi:hypothetical protein
MSKTDQRAKDQARAAYLKAHGIDRTTGRCAICYALVTVDNKVKGTRFSHRCGLVKD